MYCVLFFVDAHHARSVDVHLVSLLPKNHIISSSRLHVDIIMLIVFLFSNGLLWSLSLTAARYHANHYGLHADVLSPARQFQILNPFCKSMAPPWSCGS